MVELRRAADDPLSERAVLTAVLPKVEHAHDLAFADRLLAGAEAAAGRSTPIRLLALVETAAFVAAPLGGMTLAQLGARPRGQRVIERVRLLDPDRREKLARVISASRPATDHPRSTDRLVYGAIRMRNGSDETAALDAIVPKARIISGASAIAMARSVASDELARRIDSPGGKGPQPLSRDAEARGGRSAGEAKTWVKTND